MLAKTYEGQDVIGWMLSEKLDGVRAIWTGYCFISRTGKPINAPQWFINEMPVGIALDGELWLGRGMFQRAVGIERKKQPVDAEWQQIKYMVFDMPEISAPFIERHDMYCCLLATNPVSQPVIHTYIINQQQMQVNYCDIIDKGGEGVMLRHPDSMYEERRSPYLLKYKPTISDEATVIGYTPGKGKHEGRMGNLQCIWYTSTGELDNDRLIEVGTGFSDEERENPPAIGSTITFMYQELTDGGMPRFPVYIGVRDYE
jgi:DNA ligase-1